jgi:hypothetical protein
MTRANFQGAVADADADGEVEVDVEVEPELSVFVVSVGEDIICPRISPFGCCSV